MGRQWCYSRPRTAPQETLLDFLAAKFDYLSKDQWLEHVKLGHVRVNATTVTIAQSVAELGGPALDEGAVAVAAGDVPTELYVLKQQDKITFDLPRSYEPEVDTVNCSGPLEPVQAHVAATRCAASHKATATAVTPDYVIVSKSGNIPVSEGGRYCKNTLAAITYEKYFCSEAADRPVSRLYPAHRLDKETSGLVILATNTATAAKLTAQFERGLVHKVYEAVLIGELAEPRYVVNVGIASVADAVPDYPGCLKKVRMMCNDVHGKQSRTVIERIAVGNGLTLVRATPLTGRTHQIRLHCAHIGHPILGDKLYGGHWCSGIGAKGATLDTSSKECKPLEVTPPNESLRRCQENISVVEQDQLYLHLTRGEQRYVFDFDRLYRVSGRKTESTHQADKSWALRGCVDVPRHLLHAAQLSFVDPGCEDVERFCAVGDKRHRDSDEARAAASSMENGNDSTTEASVPRVCYASPALPTFTKECPWLADIFSHVASQGVIDNP